MVVMGVIIVTNDIEGVNIATMMMTGCVVVRMVMVNMMNGVVMARCE